MHGQQWSAPPTLLLHHHVDCGLAQQLQFYSTWGNATPHLTRHRTLTQHPCVFPCSIYWAVGPNQIFKMNGDSASPENVILLTTQQMDSVLPRSPSTVMFYPAAGSWRFAPPEQGIQDLRVLVDDLLPKLYGDKGWPAAAAVLSTAILPFIKITLAANNAVNVPVIHVYGGPGEGKTTFLELICAMVGRPENCIMQGEKADRNCCSCVPLLCRLCQSLPMTGSRTGSPTSAFTVLQPRCAATSSPTSAALHGTVAAVALKSAQQQAASTLPWPAWNSPLACLEISHLLVDFTTLHCCLSPCC